MLEFQKTITEEEVYFADRNLRFKIRGLTREEAQKAMRWASEIDSQIKSGNPVAEDKLLAWENYLLECAIKDDIARQAVKESSADVYFEILDTILNLSGIGKAAEKNFSDRSG